MTDSSIESAATTCSFPASALRSYRSALVAELALIDGTDHGAPGRQTSILRLVMDIDQMYQHDQDIAGWLCWHSDAELALMYRRDHAARWWTERAAKGGR
jgi:hypothetical protein